MEKRKNRPESTDGSGSLSAGQAFNSLFNYSANCGAGQFLTAWDPQKQRVIAIGRDAGGGVLRRNTWPDEWLDEARGFTIPAALPEIGRRNGLDILELNANGHLWRIKLDNIAGDVVSIASCTPAGQVSL